MMLGFVEHEAMQRLSKAKKKKKSMCDSIKIVVLCDLTVLYKTASAMPDPETEFKGDTRVHAAKHVASLSAMLGNSRRS